MKEKLLRRYKSTILHGPLNGKIVLGFCYYVAGPIALQSLVQQGALVIKIERKPLGDPTRQFFSTDILNTLSHGQLSVGIDYTDNNDQELINALLRIADVIVDNRSIRAKDNDKILSNFLEKDYKTNPVIYCSINGFPSARVNRMPGLDASAQAYTGLAYTNCFTPNDPLKVGIPLLDITTGLLAANYILANLVFLNQKLLPMSTKQVIQIAVSLAGTSVWLQANQFLDAMVGKEYLRVGNRDRYAVPFSYYTAKDGLISIATVNETQFSKFCKDVLENPQFHKRYPTILKRIEDQDAFESDLNALLRLKNKDYWLEKCKEHDIPAAPVLKPSQALKQNFVKQLITTTRDGGPIVTHGVEHSFFKKLKNPRPAPQLGEDSKEVKSVITLKSKL